MNFKKIFSILIALFFVTFPLVSYADDYLETSDYVSQIAISASSDAESIPIINARHAVVIDRSSKNILYGKNENEQCKMASTTKIMTAIVVLENCNNLQEVVTISQKSAGTGGSRLGLSTNDKITVENLLYGLMLVSGNDAAVALAEFIGGDIEKFSLMMNEKASSLGLKNTNFETPHGLDSDNHYTTAYELALLANYALNNPTFSKIVKTSNYTVNINGSAKTLNNTNELLGYLDGVYGVKTGFTNGANRCLVTSCKRDNLDIICVVLGCDTKKNRTLDSIKLINYTFDNFTMVNIQEIITQNFNTWKNGISNSFTINKGITSTLDLYYNENNLPYTSLAVYNNSVNNISTPIEYKANYQAPLISGTKIGTMEILIDNKPYFTVDILNRTTIPKKDIFHYFRSFFTPQVFRSKSQKLWDS